MTRTTITLDDDVQAKLKTAMKKSGKSFKETVNETLRIGLLQPQTKPAKPLKIRARNMGLKPGFTFDKPWDIIEAAEGPFYK